MCNSGVVERRNILKTAAAFCGLSTLAVIAPGVAGAAQESEIPTVSSPEARLEDVLAGPNTKLTIERRGQIVLFGINRPYIQNRIDPETFEKLAEAYYRYDHDPSLRVAILFGHGEHFSRGIDVDGFKSLAGTGKPWIASTWTIDPLAKRAPNLTKPLIMVTHGDTWNMAREIFLVADIRIACADTHFGQDENTHGRFPGGGSTVRFVRESGWGNAMRYMLLADFWNKKLGILGALGSVVAFLCTVTIIPFMPDGWAPSAGGFPAMTANVAFPMKDAVLLAMSFYLLKQDLVRATIRTNVFAEQEAVVR